MGPQVGVPHGRDQTHARTGFVAGAARSYAKFCQMRSQ